MLVHGVFVDDLDVCGWSGCLSLCECGFWGCGTWDEPGHLED